MTEFVLELLAITRHALLNLLVMGAAVVVLVLAPLVLLVYWWALLWQAHVVPAWRRWRGARA